ncbi:MAG: lipase, partial [Planctomycetota bacterium]
MKTLLTLTLCLASMSGSAFAQDAKYKTELNIPYYNESTRKADPYIKERCELDIYYPEGKNEFATIVWFHGGGLTGG